MAAIGDPVRNGHAPGEELAPCGGAELALRREAKAVLRKPLVEHLAEFLEGAQVRELIRIA